MNLKSILNRMLSKIDPSYDTNKGSFFYDLLTPVAIEIQNIIDRINEVLNRRFVATSSGDDLTANCAEMGIDRKAATYSTGYVIIKGSPGSIVTQGEKVSSDLINFIFTESKEIGSTGEVKVLVKCELPGSIGNVPAGSIKSFPKTLSGLNEVNNSDSMTGGYDQESDEDLKERYYIAVRTPSTSGNKFQYQSWALLCSGTGGARVVPLWAGKGTVKVIIINADKVGADEQLIKTVATYIEEVRPIGADVTVVSATEKKINISVKIAADIDNYTVDTAKENVTKNISNYLKEMAFKRSYVSYAKIGALILDSEGVIDYSNLKVNESAENIVVADDEVAVIGGVTYE
ncbi:baseplate J/gp47 family protein [Clostridium botulinum]|uniref:baseplate J/gp47 family protein n=1 Tax=Clostridium botulinum TaxID=1491 RepID=UPI001C9A4B95|nr:baseplate J/gp47 family protein [Clostridium botulinum]MBY6860794.1 baseplate J/gp47 family protein [Clostridium botulinum]MBY7043817.1 baseplate J/gp47 family protein [Clostridium botulinum]